MALTVTELLSDEESTEPGTNPGSDSIEAAAGRARFVNALLVRYRLRLLRYLTGLLRSADDAEDVIQECCARLLQVPRLEDSHTKARAYLFRMATNIAYDRFRSRRARGTRVELDEQTLTDDGIDPSDIVDFDQCLDIIKRTILDLRPRSRQVFLLRTSEQLSYQQIADTLSISTRTVEREMRHALDLCQRRLRPGRQS